MYLEKNKTNMTLKLWFKIYLKIFKCYWKKALIPKIKIVLYQALIMGI